MATLFGTYARVLRPTNANGRVREFSVGADVELTGDHRGRQVLTQVGGLNFGMLFADGGEFKASVTSTFERLEAPFRLGSGLEIAPGAYRFEDVGAKYQSNKSARLSGSLETVAGEFWTGRQRAITGSLRVRVDAHVAASASVGRSAVELPEGAFTAGLVGLRLDWSFTPRMFLNAFVQYSSDSDLWISNVRYNFIHRPLSDIYVVWNETRLRGVARRALLFKYTYLIAM